MTILLYDYIELEDRAARHLRVWKVWHVILYILAVVFGILNFVFLQNTLDLFDGNCILYPRHLEFHMVEIPQIQDDSVAKIENGNTTLLLNNFTTMENDKITEDGNANNFITAENDKLNNESVSKNLERVKRNGSTENPKEEVHSSVSENATNIKETKTNSEITVTFDNVTIVIANGTHHLMLEVSRSLFGKESDCQFAEYVPLGCTVFAAVWVTLFIMCPSGGRTRSGLQQPWRILTPALLFALVVVGLTGHSFSLTNGGLQAFCSSFHNITNSTTCSSVDLFVERTQNTSWGVGRVASAARAASAGAWAAWACVAAVLLARCLAAPDFVVRRTGVYLVKDPQQKIIPYLQKSPGSGKRSAPSSPSKREHGSVKSEPTVTTELVTASVEHAQDSAPTSLNASPLKNDQRKEILELTHSPEELFKHNR